MLDSFDARPTGMHLKREAKLLTMTGLTNMQTAALHEYFIQIRLKHTTIFLN